MVNEEIFQRQHRSGNVKNNARYIRNGNRYEVQLRDRTSFK